VSKTVWERCFKKTVAIQAANDHVQKTDYSIFVRLMRVNVKANEQGDVQDEDQQFEFVRDGTEPPSGEIHFIVPDRLQGKVKAQEFAARYIGFLEHSKWKMDHTLDFDDWD